MIPNNLIKFAPILSLLVFASVTYLAADDSYDPERLEREILVPASRDAIQLEVLANGDILFVEFHGTVKRWNAKTGKVRTLGVVSTYAKGEVGLLGMAASRDFLETGYFYAIFCPSEKPDTMRVSRFTAGSDRLVANSEVELLSWPYDTEHVYHMGGAMLMDEGGLLYVGNGDNCHWNPGLPVDFREGRHSWDAFRSAANSRDYRGKILRIRPTPEGSYQIPEGNLFPGGKDGLPEIFAMGIRNPFRISLDEKTKTLYIGDVGPNVLPKLGVTPVGYEEINATRQAANFGWPSFIGPNEPLPLFDFDTEKETGRQDPDKPTNPSPNNTGIRNLPPAKPALIWYDNLRSDRFPELGSGGRSVMAGPVYRFDRENPSNIKLPESFDNRLFVYEWMRNLIVTAKLDTDGPELEPFRGDWNLRRPIDMKIGPDGALYMIEYGDQWWENVDSRIVRVVYRKGNRTPRARLTPLQSAMPQGRPSDLSGLDDDTAIAGKTSTHGSLRRFFLERSRWRFSPVSMEDRRLGSGQKTHPGTHFYKGGDLRSRAHRLGSSRCIGICQTIGRGGKRPARGALCGTGPGFFLRLGGGNPLPGRGVRCGLRFDRARTRFGPGTLPGAAISRRGRGIRRARFCPDEKEHLLCLSPLQRALGGTSLRTGRPEIWRRSIRPGDARPESDQWRSWRLG